MKKATISLVFAVFLSCVPLFAQRTMAGHAELSGSGTMAFDSFGASLSCGIYTLGGFWDGGFSLVNHEAELSSGEILPYVHAAAFGGYNQRIIATSDRRFGLYAGAGVFIGYEMIDPRETVSPDVVTGLEDETVIYGLYAKAEVEAFLTGHVALVPFVKVPYCLSSQVYSVLYEAGVSLRYNF